MKESEVNGIGGKGKGGGEVMSGQGKIQKVSGQQARRVSLARHT